MLLTCASCGNEKSFLVKTLQLHVVHIEDSRVEVDEESRPAILELLCEDCEEPLNLDDIEDAVRRELALTVGSR